MGAVMPPEVESGTQLQSNGNPEKSGVNGHVGDLPVVAANGKISETSDELNGFLDLENRPHEEGQTEDMVSSSNGEEEITPKPEDQNDEATGGSDASQDFTGNAKAANGLFNGGGPSTVSEDLKSPNSDWTAPEGNSGWEVAGDESVLGPGPAQEKAGEHKATGTPELYSFWMVKIPRPVDNKGKAEIRMAELRVKEKTEKRDFINAAYQMKKANRAEAVEKLRAAREKSRACGEAVRNKKDEIEPLSQANRKFREAGRIARDRTRDLPATEEELDHQIRYLEYRIEHESMPLKEEKQLIRDIKNLKGCRDEVCANAARNAEYAESVLEREEIQERLKPLITELEALKTEWTAASERVKSAELELEKMEMAANEVFEQLTIANIARQEAFEQRGVLMKTDNARSDEFYRNKRDIQSVRQLAFKKDKKSVEELCNAQVERILGLWNSSAEFRATYIKSNERSTLKRLSTFDGRSLGPDEEPPLIPGDEEAYVESRIEAGSSTHQNMRKGVEQTKPQTKSAEPKKSGLTSISTSDSEKMESEPEIPLNPVSNGSVAPTKATTVAAPVSEVSKQKQVEEDLAAAESKEKRRQQEMAKAKEAEERKKRMLERSQSKALARAQKEAEKKEKEKEKRARKKAAAGTQHSSRGLSSPRESATEVLQEAEASPEVRVQEIHSGSKPSSNQRKRPITAQQKGVKPVKPPPVPSSITKKDVAIYQQTWFLILLGMVLLFGLLASMARYVL